MVRLLNRAACRESRRDRALLARPPTASRVLRLGGAVFAVLVASVRIIPAVPATAVLPAVTALPVVWAVLVGQAAPVGRAVDVGRVRPAGSLRPWIS